MKARWGAVLLLALGCARKAPGPEECRAFAMEALHVHPRHLNRPVVPQSVEALAGRCLSASYTQATRRCVLLGGDEPACVARFEPRGPSAP